MYIMRDISLDTIKLALFGVVTLALGALFLLLVVMAVSLFVGIITSIVRGEAQWVEAGNAALVIGLAVGAFYLGRTALETARTTKELYRILKEHQLQDKDRDSGAK